MNKEFSDKSFSSVAGIDAPVNGPGDISPCDPSKLSTSELSLIEIDETFRLDAFESRRFKAKDKKSTTVLTK